MGKDSSVALAVAGLGGYAGSIIDLILEAGPTCDPPVRLVAVCDPRPGDHAERVAELEARGVSIHGGYDTMLAVPDLEAVWLPVPIDLHVPFAEAALARGLAVMVEKPVAGTIDELDRLIAARDAAGRPVAVGFQDIYDELVLRLKRRLLEGELGTLQRASVRGCWPRTQTYFQRSSWAGTIQHRGTWVLDSPVNNAMAHLVNVALFLMGADLGRSAVPARIEAELYRAARIENYDTASLCVGLADRPDLLVLMTHACATSVNPMIEITGSRGSLRLDAKQLTMQVDGRSHVEPRDRKVRWGMLESFARLVRGVEDPRRTHASLEMARSHTLVVNGASQASPITPIPEALITEVEVGGSPVRACPGIEAVITQCAAAGQMLHESGRLSFTRPADALDLTGYDHFAGPHAAAAARPD